MTKRGPEYLLSEEKRRLDVVGSGALLGGLAPVLCLSGLLSALDTRVANPLFTQKRIGKHGQRIDVFKFLSINPKLTDDTPVQTLGTFDERATKLGLFMRQIGLDELPQLINVLQGSMSLVGHRPLLEEDIVRREAASPTVFQDWYEAYQNFKPGLIGESQILRHHYLYNSPELLRTSMQMDLDYVEGASLEGDVGLILASPFRMIAANIHPVNNLGTQE